ncbi:helix-turn-helix domain-containing protein [Micromonospora sp. LOL_024]|uniref:helix-turn-helix transcriptional regulator n=1 Tax=Micromonospora sp. LOL_024 TaxID=3345412 RepID=UPI003A8538AC
MSAETRGILYPARLPSFRRVPPPPHLDDLVRWFWIPEWDFAADHSSRQYLVAYPACHLVVEPAQVSLSGPTTRLSYRDLTGRGWAVGALLRPAAVPLFVDAPADLRDSERLIEAPELHRAVVQAMRVPEQDARHVEAVETFSEWLAARALPASGEGRLANAMADLIDSDPDVRTLPDAASRLHISPRTLQRLAIRYVGLTPVEMIRRRRLQEAAQRVRLEPTALLSQIATELGYTDHAHLTREFRERLGFTPTTYRRGV